MSCSISFEDEVAVVAPRGRLDAASARAFQDALLHAAKSVEGEIVLDFSAVSGIASAALTVLAEVLPDITASRCKIVGSSPRILRLLSLAALDQVVAIEGLPDGHATSGISQS